MKHKVTITLRIDPAEYYTHDMTPWRRTTANAAFLVGQCLLGKVDFPACIATIKCGRDKKRVTFKP